MGDPFSLRDAIDPLALVDPSWKNLVPIADLAAWQHGAAPDRQWVLQDWLPHCQATYLTGPGSAGKSLLAQQLATCVALGVPFMGVSTRQSNAMYLTCEDDLDELHRRQVGICGALGVDMAALAGNLHLVSLAGHLNTELATFEKPERGEHGDNSPAMRPTKRFRALEGTAIAHEVGFIALDNVAHLFTGNENIRNEVAAFMALMNRLARRTSGSVLLIGHPNKAGDSFSGSTAWENQVRSRLYLETPRRDDGSPVDPDARVLSRQKSNYATNGATMSFRWHKWAFVDEATLPTEYRDELQKTIEATRDNELFLACLAERNRQKRPVSEHPAANYAPKQFAAMPESQRIGRQRLTDAMDRLFRTGKIERGVVCRDPKKRRDQEGLIEVQQAPQTPAPNRAQTPAQDCPTPVTPSAPNTYPIPKGIGGAALGSAAPHNDDDIMWDDQPEEPV
jgi:RecA-family ATPase